MTKKKAYLEANRLTHETGEYHTATRELGTNEWYVEAFNGYSWYRVDDLINLHEITLGGMYVH